MKKKVYITPNFTTVTLNSKPLLYMASQLGDTKTNGSSALAKGGMFWSDDEPEDVDY